MRKIDDIQEFIETLFCNKRKSILLTRLKTNTVNMLNTLGKKSDAFSWVFKDQRQSDRADKILQQCALEMAQKLQSESLSTDLLLRNAVHLIFILQFCGNLAESNLQLSSHVESINSEIATLSLWIVRSLVEDTHTLLDDALDEASLQNFIRQYCGRIAFFYSTQFNRLMVTPRKSLLDAANTIS